MNDAAWERLPQLSTPRLHLRTLTPNDRDDLFAIYGDPDVMQYTNDPPFPDRSYVNQMLASVAALFAQRQSLEWGIALRNSGQVIGTCGLHSFDTTRRVAEIGCVLRQSHWGQSLMREALDAVIAFGFDVLDLRTIEADIDAPNDRSARLFQRLGFEQVPGEETLYERRRSAL